MLVKKPESCPSNLCSETKPQVNTTVPSHVTLDNDLSSLYTSVALSVK